MNIPTQLAQSSEFDFRTNRPWRWSPIRAIKRWMTWRREERRIMRDINNLLELDDYLLTDMGLTRQDITAAQTGSSLEGAEP